MPSRTVFVVGTDAELSSAVRDAVPHLVVRVATELAPRDAVGAQAVVVDSADPVATHTAMRLRRHFRTAFIPIVHVVDDTICGSSALTAFGCADDWLVRSRVATELGARLELCRRRVDGARRMSSLMDLPAGPSIASEISHRLAAGTAVAALHVDVDDFKAYNDRHGFARGDALIRSVGRSVVEAVQRCDPEGYVGHVGGDDFVALVAPDAADAVVVAINAASGVDAECTLSVGVAHAMDGDTAEALAERAAAAKGSVKGAKARRSSVLAGRGPAR